MPMGTVTVVMPVVMPMGAVTGTNETVPPIQIGSGFEP
jgi:hypothetical protein